MREQEAYEPPIIDSILHPSDFSEASAVAFAHALKAALMTKSRLTLLHVSPDMEAEWSDFPSVRQTLERWGLLAPSSPRSAVPALGIDVRKVIAHARDPVSSVLHYLETHPADLIVLAPHLHNGRRRRLYKSVSESLSREAGQATLFVPDSVKGFVSVEDGSVSLQSIVISVAPGPRPQPAVDAAARLVKGLSLPAGTFRVLYVGAAGDMPALNLPQVPGWQWDRVSQRGHVIETILDTARSTDAGLIVMATGGRKGFLDTLRGSHSERVLRRTPCPLLTIPEEALVTDALRDATA